MKKISATDIFYVRDGVPGLRRARQVAELVAHGADVRQIHSDILKTADVRSRRSESLQERARLLAPSSRAKPRTLVVVRLGVLGWSTAEVCVALAAAAKRKLSVRVLDVGKTFDFDAATADLLLALAGTEVARKRVVTEAVQGAGVKASAEKRRRQRTSKLDAAMKDWERPVTEITAAEIAEKHKISARSLATYLGPRRVAIQKAAEREADQGTLSPAR